MDLLPFYILAAVTVLPKRDEMFNLSTEACSFQKGSRSGQSEHSTTLSLSLCLTYLMTTLTWCGGISKAN